MKLAIVPAVFAVIVLAVISPVILAADAVISPFCFTLKFEVLMNMYLSSSIPPTNGEPLKKRFVLLSESSSAVKPPIKPALAVIVPSNLAPLAIRIPSLSTIKLGPNFT